MYAHLKDTLLAIDFIREDNPEYGMIALRRFLSRVRLYSKDVKIIRGICRQLGWFAGKQKS